MSENKGVGNHSASTEVLQLELEPDPSGPGSPPPKSMARPPWFDRPLPAKGFLRKQMYQLPPALGAPQRVSDIMTRQVIAIEPNSTLEPIEDGMRRFGIRHLPVIDPDNRLVGVLSHRELMHAESSTLSADRAVRDEVILKRATVAHIMSREPITVTPDSSLQEAGKILLRYKIGCLPVVVEDNRLVGIVTRSDFVKLALHYVTQASVAPPSDGAVPTADAVPTEGDDAEPTGTEGSS